MIMHRMKFFISIILTIIILMVQAGGVFAAPALQASTPITGTVQSITLEADPTTGVTTVIVNLIDANQISKTVRVSQETAIALGLVTLDGDGNPVINELALGESIEIDPTTVIPDQEVSRHPVASALATFFSDIEGIDYDTIMSAHENGVGFGVIAQALWLTTKLEGNSDIFNAILHAKTTGDYSAFILEDGTAPQNWGQLRKAILSSDKKNSLGIVMSNHDNNGNHANGNGNNKDKDKNKDKNNNGNGNNGNGPNK